MIDCFFFFEPLWGFERERVEVEDGEGKKNFKNSVSLSSFFPSKKKQVMGVLFLFYFAFHVGSYFALSKLYKQKR